MLKKIHFGRKKDSVWCKAQNETAHGLKRHAPAGAPLRMRLDTTSEDTGGEVDFHAWDLTKARSL
jgi:hypothetical protein